MTMIPPEVMTHMEDEMSDNPMQALAHLLQMHGHAVNLMVSQAYPGVMADQVKVTREEAHHMNAVIAEITALWASRRPQYPELAQVTQIVNPGQPGTEVYVPDALAGFMDIICEVMAREAHITFEAVPFGDVSLTKQ